MKDNILTPERILEAAEDVLRRYGPSKTTVVDVARALDVSHGSVYRHFASKAELRDAVAERWLARILPPLEAVVGEAGPAEERLRRWFDLLITTKHGRVLEDPELFATYIALASDAREVVQEHVDTLIDQISKIIEDGIRSGEFKSMDAKTTGRAVFDATVKFHKPVHASEWADPKIKDEFEGVWALIVAGLRVR